jgi:adenylate cyclase
VPGFKAGLHVGPVTGGEIGDIKRDIVFHGDTINTAARIRSECGPLGVNLLLSAEVFQRLPGEKGLTAAPIGRIRLRGKETDVELFTFAEAA